MDAIKESDRNEKRKEQEKANEEIRLREEALKEDVKKRLKKKMKLLEKEEENKKLKEEAESAFLVKWKNSDEKGIKYEGEYNENSTFIIRRGFSLFHLYIVDPKIITESWRSKSHTSMSLHALKEKADKILKESIKKEETLKNKKDQK